MQQLADYEQLSKWFLLLIRMLSAKLSDLIAAGSLGPSDRALCSNIAGFVMVFLESNPRRALDVVATLDDLLPMVSSANGEKLAEDRGQSLSRYNLLKFQLIDFILIDVYQEISFRSFISTDI
ncbi:unnamed protein product [Anisakis simplex]|uniref:Uncharacterized protein n=1 Tax=Anisakis simplex TaxID=6269 RepID=A0A0M3JEW0_ANISI|nr:unnamed protein product [Anisakis simplex]VDK26304.1 unnamed protein product [Anisakis simplex]